MDEQYPHPASATLPAQASQGELVRAYISKVYTWMAVSLAVTAGVAIYAANSLSAITWVMEHTLLLCIVTLGIVVVMSFGARAFSSGALGILLLTFSAVEGMLFGPLLLLYTSQSLGLAFACTAGMFGGMALYGAYTKRDLTKWGSYLFMALIGLIIAGIANLFFGNGMADLIISAAGVLIFCLFTAYDTQKLLAEGGAFQEEELRAKGAVLGALSLYLDFINLFLYLLRFLGKVKD